jgi:hypothetical protein
VSKLRFNMTMSLDGFVTDGLGLRPSSQQRPRPAQSFQARRYKGSMNGVSAPSWRDRSG